MKKEKYLCPDCGKKMYLLPDSSTSTYVCPGCGCSIDEEDQDLDSEDTSLHCGQFLDAKNDKKFMKDYTKYDNFTDFILDSGLIPQDISGITYELFQNIPRDQLDTYVKSNSVFSSWDDMFDKATSRYLKI